MSDPDEKVRIAFCKIFSQIDYESALKLVDKELLEVLGSRCRDRKVIRNFRAQFWRIMV